MEIEVRTKEQQFNSAICLVWLMASEEWPCASGKHAAGFWGKEVQGHKQWRHRTLPVPAIETVRFVMFVSTLYYQAVYDK